MENNNFDTRQGYQGYQSVNFRSVAARALAVFGFIAVIGVGLWGSVQIASGVPGAFSSLAAAFVSLTSIFVPAGETISLSVPTATVQSGQPFTMTWTHNKQSMQGSYTFRYDCADGVYFNSPASTGTDTMIYCNVPFNFLNSNNSIVLKPISSKNRFIDVTVYINFTPNGASRPTITGKTSITVENDTFGTSPSAVGTTTSTPTPTQPTYHHLVTPGTTQTHTYPIGGTNAQPSNPNGYVDLTAHVIEVGIVDKTTGAFYASSTPSLSETTSSGQYRIAVRFAVENIGTKTSPQFDFSAVLPTLPSYVFNSPMQQELAPGDRIEFTLAFDSFDPKSNGVFTINVDPEGRINESNKANNIIHYTITTTP